MRHQGAGRGRGLSPDAQHRHEPSPEPGGAGAATAAGFARLSAPYNRFGATALNWEANLREDQGTTDRKGAA